MDGSAFKNMDLSKLLPWWLLVLAGVGLVAIAAVGFMLLLFVWDHVHWV